MMGELLLKQAVSVLNNGGVLLVPTDTVFGLAAIPSNKNAVEKIYQLKKRPLNLFLPIMVSNISALENLSVDINDNIRKLLSSDLVPGAITFVAGFKNDAKKPLWLENRDEIAFRIPDNAFLLSVLDVVGVLLVTSANLHGESKTPNNINDILSQLNGNPDLIIDGDKGKDVPSTIINCRKENPVIERAGLISEKTIFNILKNE